MEYNNFTKAGLAGILAETRIKPFFKLVGKGNNKNAILSVGGNGTWP